MEEGTPWPPSPMPPGAVTTHNDTSIMTCSGMSSLVIVANGIDAGDNSSVTTIGYCICDQQG
ncbi:Signal transduction histidine kinase [Sesbania bispinosa]|nr:Signal transduction histidine kinase [Sesbania bispinosa]